MTEEFTKRTLDAERDAMNGMTNASTRKYASTPWIWNDFGDEEKVTTSLAQMTLFDIMFIVKCLFEHEPNDDCFAKNRKECEQYRMDLYKYITGQLRSTNVNNTHFATVLNLSHALVCLLYTSDAADE